MLREDPFKEEQLDFQLLEGFRPLVCCQPPLSARNQKWKCLPPLRRGSASFRVLLILVPERHPDLSGWENTATAVVLQLSPLPTGLPPAFNSIKGSRLFLRYWPLGGTFLNYRILRHMFVPSLSLSKMIILIFGGGHSNPNCVVIWTPGKLSLMKFRWKMCKICVRYRNLWFHRCLGSGL